MNNLSIGTPVWFRNRINNLYPLKIVAAREMNGRTEYKLSDGKWWYANQIKTAE